MLELKFGRIVYTTPEKHDQTIAFTSNALFYTAGINYNAAWAKILLILQNKINNPLGMQTN